MAHENLLATIEAIRNSNPDRWNKTPYQNERELWGWHFAFPYYGSWHFVSIHNLPAALPRPELIANAIEGIDVILDEKWGIYGNKKGILGYYATARSTRALDGSDNHWFMIGRSFRKNIESAQTEVRSLLLQKSFLKPEETDILQYLSRRTDKHSNDSNPFLPGYHRRENIAETIAKQTVRQY